MLFRPELLRFKHGKLTFQGAKPLPLTFVMTRNLPSLPILAAAVLLSVGCIRPKADMILYNGHIQTVDDSFRVVSAMAIRDGKILATGPDAVLLDFYDADTTIDLLEQTVYPGFIDAHSHFFGYASDLLKADLTGTASFREVLDRLVAFSQHNHFDWILGRGWDQNDWPENSFPDCSELDMLFPDRPVFLVRIDGHAALCNSAALSLAKIDASTKVAGGEILLKNGKPTGLLIDNAVELVSGIIPPFPEALNRDAILTAQANCFKAGLTTVTDAGLDPDSIRILQELQDENQLKLRLNVMLSYRSGTSLSAGPLIEDRLTVRAVKVYADGALGSRGALLKKPYSDQEDHYGLLLQDSKQMEIIFNEAYRHGFQVCTHAIGDSAVSLVLELYGRRLLGTNNRRWRIEHSQVVEPDDLPLFREFSVIPSVQPTHATSDMYWAENRLGKERISNAYSYRQQLDAAGTIAFGTDFPVEKIDPLLTFYAAVVRKDLKGFPEGGFQPGNRIDRKDALRAMTAGAAYSNFEESRKGSLTSGKFADFVILDRDLLTVQEDELSATKVLATYVGGEKVY
ncbi:MAG: hypothetical protein RL021_1797 [Bacteroidota bacterium]